MPQSGILSARSLSTILSPASALPGQLMVLFSAVQCKSFFWVEKNQQPTCPHADANQGQKVEATEAEDE